MGLLISIIVAVITASSINNKVATKQEFSGFAWGLLNGIFGVGILPAIFAHSSINGTIAKSDDPTYAQNAKDQMHTFTTTYVVCVVIWIIIAIATYSPSYISY